MIKQMNRVMHDGEEAYYEVPTDPKKYGLTGQDSLRRLIAQYLLLYSGNLSSFVNSTDSPTELRMVVQLKDSNPSFLQKVKQDIAVYADAHLRQLGYAVETVGLPDEMLAMNRSIMRSQVTSVSIALLCVLIAMWIAYRSFRVGLAGLIPIALSLLLNFAAMGFLHIPLDIVTAIIASVAVGIGIDYSIHVVSAYIFEYRLTGSTEEAAHRTLGLTGRAIFYNVMSVTLGFAVLVFSMFTPLNSVGILMGVIMLTSSFFSLTLLPVVLRAIVPRLVTGGSVRPAETISGTLTSETTNRRNK
jgi:predicted RND superfamily exporter protein